MSVSQYINDYEKLINKRQNIIYLPNIIKVKVYNYIINFVLLFIK
jgi:hypothetical protein